MSGIDSREIPENIRSGLVFLQTTYFITHWVEDTWTSNVLLELSVPNLEITGEWDKNSASMFHCQKKWENTKDKYKWTFLNSLKKFAHCWWCMRRHDFCILTQLISEYL